MICYHTTDAADAILTEGFRDTCGMYPPFDHEVTGVFLCERPVVDAGEGATGEEVLQVDFADGRDLDGSEIGVGTPRTWHVPAALIKEHATVKLLTMDEVDEVVSASLGSAGDVVLDHGSEADEDER